MNQQRIFLSPPHQTGEELEAFREVLSSNWLAPVGPDIQKFEKLIAEATGFKYVVATTSGTAALHLGLRALGIQAGSKVVSSSMTFIGAVNPILYQGAKPVFIDSEAHSWNLDLDLLEQFLADQPSSVSAILPTHLYGMPVDVTRLEQIAVQFRIPVLHDLAECLAGTVNEKTIGQSVARGALSFNGNKLVTTSGGGAFVTNNQEEARLALSLATQAKLGGEYLHQEIGYNYRMSNVLATLGISQIKALEQKKELKKKIHKIYCEELEPIGLTFQSEPENIKSDRWLTTLILPESITSRIDPGQVVARMNECNVEVRRVWRPMPMQPLFKGSECVGGQVAEVLFHKGLCLPSGCGMTASQQSYVIEKLKKVLDV